MGNKQSKSAGFAACFGKKDAKQSNDLPENVSTPKSKKQSTLNKILSISPRKTNKNATKLEDSPDSLPIAGDFQARKKHFSLNDPKVEITQVNVEILDQGATGDENHNQNRIQSKQNIDSLFTTAIKPKNRSLSDDANYQKLLQIESAKIAENIIMESLQDYEKTEEEIYVDQFEMNREEDSEAVDLVVVHSKIQQEATFDEKANLQGQWEMNKYQLARSKSIEKQKQEKESKNNNSQIVKHKKSQESSELCKNETSYGISDLKSDPTLNSSDFQRSRNSSMVHTDSIILRTESNEDANKNLLESWNNEINNNDIQLKRAISRRSSVVYCTDSVGNHSISKQSKISQSISKIEVNNPPIPIKVVPLKLDQENDPYVSSSDTKIDSKDFDNATENDFLNSLQSEEVSEGSMIKFINLETGEVRIGSKNNSRMDSRRTSVASAYFEPLGVSRVASKVDGTQRRQSVYSLGPIESEEILHNQKNEVHCWEVADYKIGPQDDDETPDEELVDKILDTIPAQDSGNQTETGRTETTEISKSSSLADPTKESCLIAEAADSNHSPRTLDDKCLTTLEEDHSNMTPRTVRTGGQNTANDLTPDSTGKKSPSTLTLEEIEIMKQFAALGKAREQLKQEIMDRLDTCSSPSKKSGDTKATPTKNVTNTRKNFNQGESLPPLSTGKKGSTPQILSPPTKKKYNNRKRNKNKRRSSSRGGRPAIEKTNSVIVE